MWETLGQLFTGTDHTFVTNLKTSFDEIVDLGDPAAFGRLAVRAFVDLVKAAVSAAFTFVNALAGVALEIVESALTGIAGVLSAPIDAPPIVALFNWLHDQAYPADDTRPATPVTVTIGGLFSLMLAFPVTYAWKLAAGADVPLFPGGHFPPTGGAPSIGDSGTNPWPLIGGIVQISYFFPDTYNDLVTAGGRSSNIFMTLWALACEITLLLMSFPNPTSTPFIWFEDTDPNAAFSRMFNFIATAAIVMLDVGSFLTPDAKTKQLARQRDTLGKTAVTVAGVLNLAFGIWQSIAVKDTPASTAANVLTPLTAAAQFLRMWEPPLPSAVGTKVAINIASDAGGGIARFASAFGA
jgi:hypothetical protein